MKKFLLATAMVVGLVGLASAESPAPKQNEYVGAAPSLLVLSRKYEAGFENAACAKRALHTAKKISKNVSEMNMSPSNNGIYMNDSEVAIDIQCNEAASTVVFVVGSTKLKLEELKTVMAVVSTIFDEKDWNHKK